MSDLERPANLWTLVEGVPHAEGICWSPRGRVLYAGTDDGRLYRFGLDGGTPELVTSIAGAFFLGLAVDGEGSVYACDVGWQRVQRIRPDGSVEPYGDTIGYPNYPVFDADGRLWVSDSGSWAAPEGGLVRIVPGGATERVPVRPLHFANGLAISGNWLYIIETSAPRVIRLPLAGGDPEPIIELERVAPDGLAFDEEGGLWISCYQPNRIYRLCPDGTLRTIVDDWTGSKVVTPTNVAFAGDRLDVLAIAQLGGWSVKALEPGVRGAALYYPMLP